MGDARLEGDERLNDELDTGDFEWYLACCLVRAMTSARVPVAIWVSSFAAGGTERQMVELIRRLDPTRFEVHAACLAARGPWLSAAQERARSVPEFFIGSFARPATWRQILRFSRWCREHNIQVVLASDFYTNVFALTGAALARVPVRIGGRREINTDKTPAKLMLQRAAYAGAHRVVANSQAAAERLRTEGVPAGRITVISNGIDTSRFVCSRSPRPIRRALTVANLRPEKGIDVLIDAVAGTPALAEIEFQIAGDGPCRADLERRARDRGVVDRIRFLGERHDIPSLLAAADIFILPSRTEAFPNSVMEAMASGLPVVATGVGGILELVEDAVSGWLVRPGDSAALGAAVAALAKDPGGAHEMGRRARGTVESRYSIDNMVAGFESVFTSELRRRNRTMLQRDAAHVSQAR